MIRLLLLLSLPLYILDQWSKLWIVKRYPLNGFEDEIIPGFLLAWLAIWLVSKATAGSLNNG